MYHLRVSVGSRSAGQSAAAKDAYIERDAPGEVAQWFKRHNAQTPEQGGARKTRALLPRDWLTDTREAWATEVNRTLERHDLRERVDHRSLAVRATEAYTRGDFDAAAALSREPGVHLGPAALRAAGGAELAVVDRARQVYDDTHDASRRWESHTFETNRLERAIGDITHGLQRLQQQIAEVRDRVHEWIQQGRPEPTLEPERGPTLDPDFGPSRYRMPGIHETLARVEALYRTQQDAVAKLERAVASLDRWERDVPNAHAAREAELKLAYERLMVQVDQIYWTLRRVGLLWFVFTIATSAIAGIAAFLFVWYVLR